MHPVRSLFKAVAIAAVSAAMMFFLGIFLTLMVLLAVSLLSGTKPDLTVSYRIVGLTAGATAFVLGFCGSILHDLRSAATGPR